MQFFLGALARPIRVGNSIWHFLFRGVAKGAFIFYGDIAELKAFMGLRGHWKNVIGPCLRPIGWLGLRAWFPVRWFGVGEPGNHLLILGFSLTIWLRLDLFIVSSATLVPALWYLQKTLREE